MAVQQWQSGNLLSGSMNPSSALGVAANASGNMFTQLTQAQQIADIEREREWRRNELKRADARRSEIAGQADKLFNEEDLAAQARINAMGSDALLSEIGQGNWQVGENPGMLLYSNNDNLQAGFRDRGERETAADYIKAQRAAAFAPGTDFSDGITEFRGRGERETAEDYLKAMRGPAAAERLAKQTARDSRIMDSRTATDEILAGKKDEITVEITTYRSESYDPTSRKPDVEFGKSIEADLARRDFTINAMALELTTGEPAFIDLFNGVLDLQKKIIKTKNP